MYEEIAISYLLTCSKMYKLNIVQYYERGKCNHHLQLLID